MKNTLPATPCNSDCHFRFLGIMLLVLILQGRMTAQKYYTGEKTYAIKLGTTKPLYSSYIMPSTDAEKLNAAKANKPRTIPNFAGRRQLEKHNPDGLPQGVDPLYDPAMMRMPVNEILPIVNIEGMDNSISGGTPPDVNGDVGRDFYVEVINSTYFKVYDKTGAAVSNAISANTIWSQVQQISSGDPILLYDQEVDRWLLTEFTSPGNNRFLVAISHTSDPRGSYDAYAFQTPRFPDFPKYGIWNNAYYVTSNESGSNFPIYAINRDDILAGVDTARIQRLTVPKIGGVFFEVGQPIDWDGALAPPAGSPGLVVKLSDDDWGQSFSDEILLHKINIDWSNASASNIEIISIIPAPFDTDGCQLENTGGFSCIPQPNNQGIDGAEWIICQRAQYRNFVTHESFVMSFMVDVTGNDVAGIRWLEFRKTAAEDWHIYQEGTVGSDDGIHRFMPSIGIDGQGNIGLGYSVSGYDKFASLRYTGRYHTDPLGTMTFQEYEFATGAGSQGSDRFGDYASMSVDPTDDATFWFAGEYFPGDNEWSTRIVAFRAHRDTVDVFPISLTEPKNDPVLGVQNVGVTIFNRGLTTVFDFPLAYQFNGGEWITENPGLDSLPVDQEYSFTFSTPIIIDVPGNYPLRIATLLDQDDNKKNDTLAFTVTKFAYRDAALEYIVPEGNGIVCSDQSFSAILVRNVGLDTLREVTFQLSYADSPIDTFQWTGDLLLGEETEFSFPIDGLTDGPNEFSLTVISANNDLDQMPSNNELEWVIQAQPNGQTVFLILRTDNFAMETSWKLFDSDNNIIASGGPYPDAQSNYVTEFCLDPEACYTYTIYDAFGDGVSQGPDGDFQIITEDGLLLAELSKANFGSESSSQFCITATCLFSVQVGVAPESSPGAGDAIAMAETFNSLGTVLYSIDGGLSFQDSSIFSGLEPGHYTLIAKDGAGCLDTVVFAVLTCTLQALITTVPAAGGDVGEIHIAVTGNHGPVLYSIQGGIFVPDSIFTMLEPGDYIVIVKDSTACEVTDSVTVSTNVSSSFITDDYFIQVSPNPGNGIYQVLASFDVNTVFIGYTMFSVSGDVLFQGSIVRYDELYKGEVSLVAYPPGLYYMAFRVGSRMAVVRVIKAG